MLEKLRTWALGEYGKAPSTTRVMLRRLRRLQRFGLDLMAFYDDPTHARETGNGALVAAKLRAEEKRPGSGRGATRANQKALNWLVDHANHLHGSPEREWRRWSLEPEPEPRTRRLTPHQVQVLREYQDTTPFRTRRARAMNYSMEHTGLRRGELARIRIQDLDLHPERPRIWVEYPSKNGRRRWAPLPRDAAHGPLTEYLQELPPRTPGDAFWITQHRGRKPKAITVNGWGRIMDRISKRVGFRVGPTIWRRTRARILNQEYGVDPVAIKTSYGHANLETTMRYIGAMDDQDVVVAFARAGVPGYA